MKWKHKQCLATQWTPTPFPSILVMCERWSTSFHSIQVHIAMAFCEHFTLNTFLFQNWKTENQKDKIAKIKWRTLKASNMACSMDRFSKCTWLRQLMLLFGFVVLFFMKPFLILFSHILIYSLVFFFSLTFRNFCYRFNYNKKQPLNVSPLFSVHKCVGRLVLPRI